MEATLASCVAYSLQNRLFENAAFLGERLVALQPESEEARALLASALLASGDDARVINLLKGMC